MAMPARQARRLYVKELGLAMVAYSLVLVATIMLVDAYPQAPWRWAAVLAPLVPVAFVVRAVVRSFGRMDELQRRIQIEALAFAFAGGSFLTLTVGFLQIVGLPSLSWLLVWPIFAVLWAIGGAWAQRRYAGPAR
jgi:O-antigen/teichoic acid export membrane protein